MYSPLGVKNPRVFTTGGWDSQVYSSPRSCFGRWGVTDFKEYLGLKLPNLQILIDSLVYSLPGNWLWIQITPWIILKSEIVSRQNTSGNPDSPLINTLGSLDSLVCLSPEFFCKPVLMLVQSTPRSQLSGVFITDESGLSGVFMIRESFRMPGSRFYWF
jgi:hypothetical protein